MTATCQETPQAFLQSIGVDPKRWPPQGMPDALTMLERLLGLESLGFTTAEALAAVHRFPFILGLTVEKVAASIAHFGTYGFKPEEIRKFIIRWASVVAYGPDRVDKVWSNFEAYGFARAQVRKIVKYVPALLCYTTDRTNRLLANIEAAGYGRESVIEIVLGCPSILCCTAEKTNTVFAVLKDVGIQPHEAPQLLNRAAYVLRGRIAFLRGQGAEPTRHQLAKSHEEFEKSWGVSRSEIVTMGSLRQET